MISRRGFVFLASAAALAQQPLKVAIIGGVHPRGFGTLHREPEIVLLLQQVGQRTVGLDLFAVLALAGFGAHHRGQVETARIATQAAPSPIWS